MYFLRQTLVAGLCIMGFGAAAEARPNILLIIADDFGRDAAPCYEIGNRKAAMPNLAALCDRGMVFETAYTPPVCTPTRAAIMTGRFGFRTGVQGAGPGAGTLGDTETSLFDVTAAEGYRNAVIGKWHVAEPGDLTHPARLGVQDYYGMFSGGVRDYFDWDGVANGRSITVREYATTHLTDRAIAFVHESRDPWFLWLAYNAPHSPFQAPPAHLHSDSSLVAGETGTRRDAGPYYRASLEALDAEMGRLLAALPEDTVIIFIGDNGSPGAVARGIYGRRGAKGTLYEGGVHVPLVVAGPGVARGRSDALVNSTDLYATIAALAGADARAEDSLSLLPALSGGDHGRAYAFVDHFSGDTRRRRQVSGMMIRDRRYKYVRLADGGEQLFDLVADPLESRDLLAGVPASEHTRAAESLSAAMDDLWR